MRIDGTGRLISPSRQAGGKRETGEVFRPDGAPAQARAQQTSAPSSAAGIDALLALQAVEDATSGRKRAIRRANDLLDSLEEIRADLLAGRISEGRLNRAVSLLQRAKDRVDPDLEALVADIELRVRVELAKLGRFPQM